MATVGVKGLKVLKNGCARCGVSWHRTRHYAI